MLLFHVPQGSSKTTSDIFHYPPLSHRLNAPQCTLVPVRILNLIVTITARFCVAIPSHPQQALPSTNGTRTPPIASPHSNSEIATSDNFSCVRIRGRVKRCDRKQRGEDIHVADLYIAECSMCPSVCNSLSARDATPCFETLQSSFVCENIFPVRKPRAPPQAQD